MKYDEQYWNERLDGCKSEKAKSAIRRVYNAYPAECMPQGICDPMYIMNSIAIELGIGDGQGNFTV